MMVKTGIAAVSIPQAAPSGLLRWRVARPAWDLLRFIAIVTLLCAVACFYFWQVSTIVSIRREAADLRTGAHQFERDNAELMLQVAAWNRPEHIKNRAAAIGMAPAAAPSAYVEVAPERRENLATGSSGSSGTWWRSVITEWGARWSTLLNRPVAFAGPGG
jgi:hypothetical protein